MAVLEEFAATEMGEGCRLLGAAQLPGCVHDDVIGALDSPHELRVESRKAIEKARMARRFLAKHPSRRARLATGAHPLNLLRARYLLPDWLLAIYAGIATSSRGPAWLGAVVRAQFLDAIYARELTRVLDER